ncbi:MAG: ATP-binding protein [Candidatus Promineifilaceae bacterium]|nr:ATP-binding protein [Candidatus Promineifilaceae bacterium]
MTLWQQLYQLLSEPPGNIVYHLVTLFAIQATLAIALSHWRRDEDDALARRLTLGALILLGVRLLFLLVSLVLAGNTDPLIALRVLPPLEQALNSVTALVVVWMLLPPFVGLPRLNDVVALLVLLLLGVMYAFFAPDWATQVEPGVTYNGSEQSTVWGIFQLSVLGLGALALALRRFPSNGLRFFPLFVLLLAHAVQFWDYPEMFPTGTEVPFWIRLGQLSAFPLLAVLAYRHSLNELLAAGQEETGASRRLADTVRLLTGVIEAPTAERVQVEATRLLAQAVDAYFVAVAVLDPEQGESMSVVSRRAGRQEVERWALNLSQWPAFRLAMEQRQPVELLPEGLGARQLHDLYREMGVQVLAPLLVAPLMAGDGASGVLVLGGQPQWERWPSEARLLVQRLAAYVARTIANVQAYESAVAEVAPRTPETEAQTTGRIIALEEERDRALAEAQTLGERLQQSDAQLRAARQQARDLAAAVEALEQGQAPSETALQAEVAALRESLVEAEEALALAAASEAEISTEWVTTTISRYSSELEEAQVRVAELEERLEQLDPRAGNEVIIALAQELRGPLTSIGSYADLLQAEIVDAAKNGRAAAADLQSQTDFLSRIEANVDRLAILLDQMIQAATAPIDVDGSDETVPVEVHEVIDQAIQRVISQVRMKDLRLNLDIAGEMPPLTTDRQTLMRVLVHLLDNAAHASAEQGEVTIRAHTDAIARTKGAAAGEISTGEAAESEGEKRDYFLHLAVTDSGGGGRAGSQRDLLAPNDNAAEPSVEVQDSDDAGDAGLAVAQMLVKAQGGRLWVEGAGGGGMTFSVLLPLKNGSAPHADEPAVGADQDASQ